MEGEQECSNASIVEDVGGSGVFKLLYGFEHVAVKKESNKI